MGFQVEAYFNGKKIKTFETIREEHEYIPKIKPEMTWRVIGDKSGKRYDLKVNGEIFDPSYPGQTATITTDAGEVIEICAAPKEPRQ